AQLGRRQPARPHPPPRGDPVGDARRRLRPRGTVAGRAARSPGGLARPHRESKRSRPMRVTYLTGDSIYLRALTTADAAVAMAWRQSPFPISPFQAEKQPEEMHQTPWRPREFTYLICRLGDDRVVGSVKLGVWTTLRAHLSFKTADWLDPADASKYACETLRLTLRWQTVENE